MIDDPHVVLRIHAHLLSLEQAVRALADLTNELACAVELEQPRPAMGNGARPAEGDRGIAGARVHVNIAARARRDAGDLAQVNVVGQRQQVRIRVELNRRDLRLAEEHAAARRQRNHDRQNECAFHVSSYRAAEPDEAGCIFDGLSMIFCARHAEISDTNS